MKKISVIVPAYNCRKYLRKCVYSIVGQEYENLEIILVDDGSSDGTGEICDALSNEDVRIRVIHQKNQGVSVARNVGIQMATGQYITFVDSDDYLMESSIYTEAVNILETNNIDVVAWLWQYEDVNGNMLVSKDKITGVNYGMQSGYHFLRSLYQSSYSNGIVVSVWNKLYRSEIVKNSGFPLIYAEDDMWSVRILTQISEIYVMEKFGYVYKENSKSLTHLKFTEKNYSMFDTLRERSDLFVQDIYLLNETWKLYCNLYIEYCFRAEESNITPYNDEKTFNCYRKNKSLNMKTKIRFLIFSLSPYVYKRIFWKG